MSNLDKTIIPNKKDKQEPTEEECIFHLEYVNDMVQQINKIKYKITSRIYKDYIKKDPDIQLDYKSFKNSIFKKRRESFTTTKNIDK